MERIGDEVDRALRRFGPAGGMPAIVAAWPAAVGETIARNAWPARIGRDGALYVHTSSSTWAFELGQLAPTILQRLHEVLVEERPNALRFVVGPLPEPAREPAEQVARAPVEPGPEARAQARELASAISDEELRERVARAVALSLARASASRAF
jgi:hypothetical protein